MKTATYTTREGEEVNIEYDEGAPCSVCRQPVIEASMGGTAVCPWCDVGKCRFCGVDMAVLKEEWDNGRSLRRWREHMTWHQEATP